MYRYELCCVESTYELISAMQDEAEDISLAELRKHCEGVDAWAVSKGYELDPDEGLTLDQDWHVSFCRSVYDGRPCYFICWSRIEFIWTQEGSGEGFGYGNSM